VIDPSLGGQEASARGKPKKRTIKIRGKKSTYNPGKKGSENGLESDLAGRKKRT